MLKFFAEKMWVAFAVQKLLTFFLAKNIRILYIESSKTVNEMTLNELVKLTTLWTTGPCTWNALTEVTSESNITYLGNISGQYVEYYPTRDMLSTN